MTEPTRPQRVAETTVDALHRGDRHAFEELYLQLHVNVYNLAARIVGDRREAEDITQEVFLRAFRHLPGTDGPLRPEAWVFRTTVNACYDHLRRRRPAPTLLAEAREAVAHDGFEQSATAAAVEKALAAINPRYRTVLVLKDLHGLGNGEIAEIMGVARGTVAVLLFRARSAFQKRYREVAPALGVGLPVAGLAAWLPTLPVPAALQTPPAFLAPLTAPIAATPLAPAAAAAPLTAGLAKLAGALTTKVAVVAIAATAVTGGSIAVHEVRRADGPYVPAAAAAAPAPAAMAEYDDWRPHALTHGAARGDLAQGAATRTGDGRDESGGARNGASTASGGGTQVRTANGGDGPTGSGTQTRQGSGSTDFGASDAGSGTGSGTATGSAGEGTGAGPGGDAGGGSGGVGASATGGGTITGETTTGGVRTTGTTTGGESAH